MVEDNDSLDTREESACQSRNHKGLKAEKENGRNRPVSALVTQEEKAKYQPHYHDDEEQRNCDHVTDIHGRYMLRLSFSSNPIGGCF
jgi:hypothetical protein